ncbi:unnamed protein product [Adineta steineri]|uniref:Uncharacterized protein n=1 Tax=Adineta steineri TaxID=433720 RepID=A0A813SU91_9BILA|nr:unnamed protein product [Adineta steineri]
MEKQKTLQQKQRQWRQNQRKHHLNKKLNNLPKFTPGQSYEIIFINYMTAFFVLLNLIKRARTTKYFTIDTETDDISGRPALIQLQLIHLENNNNFKEEEAIKSTIIIFEMCRLRSETFNIHPRAQELFDVIFHPSNIFLTWGNEDNEMLKFQNYEFVHSLPLTSLHIINVQGKFKNWYNSTYTHRPYKNPGDAWSLQMAISTIYKQFLDKSWTRSNWGQGLDIRLYLNLEFNAINYNVKSSLTDEEEQTRLKLVNYAIDDCLAVTKLAFQIGPYLPIKEINRCDDIFHEHDDDVDEDQDPYVAFDNFYQDFHTKADEDDELLQLLTAYDDKNTEEEQQQRQLSQRLSQLKTTTDEHIDTESTITIVPATTSKKRSSITPATSNYQMATKKTKTNDNETEYNDDDGDAELPRFLSRTKDIFQETMKPLLDKLSKPIDIEILRTMALYKFRIAVDDLNTFLWTAYLHSGQGKLQVSKQPTTTTTTRNISLWPSTVKELIKKTRYKSDDINVVNDNTFEDFVRAMLRDFAGHNRSRSNEIKIQKQILANSFTLEMEEAIDKFVEQHGTAFHRADTEEQIAIVEYEYEDRLIDFEFYDQTPYREQVVVFQNISERKYEKETAKMSVAILKQRLLYNHLPDSFETIHLPEPVSLETIQNNTMRQRLTEQYNKILQRTKADMFTMYIATEQAKADECVKEFDRDYAEMKETQSTGSPHKRLTPTMLQLLRKRVQNINKHLIHLFNLKTRFFDKAPTVKN